MSFSTILEWIDEDSHYLRIYIRFLLSYVPIFIPCLLGSISMDTLRKMRGEKVKVSKKMILLSSAIVTFIVIAIDLITFSENLRAQGLSIAIGFIGGLLSRSIISAISQNSFVSTMCNEFVKKNTSGSLVSAFASAIDKESSKEEKEEPEESEDDKEEKEKEDKKPK